VTWFEEDAVIDNNNPFDVVYHPDSGLENHIPKRAEKRPPEGEPEPHECDQRWAVKQHDDEEGGGGRREGEPEKGKRAPVAPPRKKPAPGKPPGR
jgi:hypothetical protein